MQKFNLIKSVVAGIPLINIDTDMIIPKQFLKTIKRTGLGKNLFHEMRFDINENIIQDFILNKPEFQNAQILVARDNFGCGSSREHAPWALLDFGIRVVIAPSFADIFFNNCFKNGILPIVLKNSEVDELLEFSKSPTNHATVDLPSQNVHAGQKVYKFEIDSFKKHCLIEGLDDIGLTLQKEQKIAGFEKINHQVTPWLYHN
ncbi:MAG: 3-isopropylmalate dehydratase small subunit [Proteobacteria bacterium]|nr:3-isopropylmalate dehydratase small subunit [Pseudomonadota bacterium]NCA27856.1 3-isopropylmalate dehydratase small subunit [Pseudomonadota bacterium]